jgi:thiamine-phosphate pyrophosphorylase
LPMVAIAGITADNAASVIATDVDGIAVVSAIVAAEDCRAAAAHLKAVIEAARSRVRLPAQR